MSNISGIIKSLQNIMRKDQGVSGDEIKKFVDGELFPGLQNPDVLIFPCKKSIPCFLNQKMCYNLLYIIS